MQSDKKYRIRMEYNGRRAEYNLPGCGRCALHRALLEFAQAVGADPDEIGYTLSPAKPEPRAPYPDFDI